MEQRTDQELEILLDMFTDKSASPDAAWIAAVCAKDRPKALTSEEALILYANNAARAHSKCKPLSETIQEALLSYVTGDRVRIQPGIAELAESVSDMEPDHDNLQRILLATEKTISTLHPAYISKVDMAYLSDIRLHLFRLGGESVLSDPKGRAVIEKIEKLLVGSKKNRQYFPRQALAEGLRKAVLNSNDPFKIMTDAYSASTLRFVRRELLNIGDAITSEKNIDDILRIADYNIRLVRYALSQYHEKEYVKCMVHRISKVDTKRLNPRSLESLEKIKQRLVGIVGQEFAQYSSDTEKIREIARETSAVRNLDDISERYNELSSLFATYHLIKERTLKAAPLSDRLELPDLFKSIEDDERRITKIASEPIGTVGPLSLSVSDRLREALRGSGETVVNKLSATYKGAAAFFEGIIESESISSLVERAAKLYCSVADSRRVGARALKIAVPATAMIALPLLTAFTVSAAVSPDIEQPPAHVEQYAYASIAPKIQRHSEPAKLAVPALQPQKQSTEHAPVPQAPQYPPEPDTSTPRRAHTPRSSRPRIPQDSAFCRATLLGRGTKSGSTIFTYTPAESQQMTEVCFALEAEEVAPGITELIKQRRIRTEYAPPLSRFPGVPLAPRPRSTTGLQKSIDRDLGLVVMRAFADGDSLDFFFNPLADLTTRSVGEIGDGRSRTKAIVDAETGEMECPKGSFAIKAGERLGCFERHHRGYDLVSLDPVDDVYIYSSRVGRIIRIVTNSRLAGNYVEIEHPDGSRTAYMHLEDRPVEHSGIKMGADGFPPLIQALYDQHSKNRMAYFDYDEAPIALPYPFASFFGDGGEFELPNGEKAIIVTKIGELGDSGNARDSTPHLHYQHFDGERVINPEQRLPVITRGTTTPWSDTAHGSIVSYAAKRIGVDPASAHRLECLFGAVRSGESSHMEHQAGEAQGYSQFVGSAQAESASELCEAREDLQDICYRINWDRVRDNPFANIFAGELLLQSELEDYNGDAAKAVGAYNIGPNEGRPGRWGMAHYERLARELGVSWQSLFPHQSYLRGRMSYFADCMGEDVTEPTKTDQTEITFEQ